MDPRTDAIVNEIEQAREDLDRDLSALERSLRHEAKAEVQLQRHPLVLVGAVVAAAFAVVVIAQLFRIGRS